MRPTFQLIVLTLILGCSNKKQTEVRLDSQGIIESNGIEFKYVRQGKGQSLLVIGSSVYYPKAYSNSLRDHFEIIFIDSRHFIPNYNPTDKELRSINLTTWADDLEMARKKLNLDKVTVIGHSIHAQIALEYANKYPDNVKRLIMICGVPFSPSEYSDEAKELWATEADENRKTILASRTKQLDSILSVTPANKQFAVNYHLNAPLYWANPNYDASYLLNNLMTSPRAFGKLVSSIPTRQDVIDKLNNLKMPTLVILGKLDFAIPYTAWEQMLQNTNISYQLIRDASHNPQTEKTTEQEFDRILTTWISNNE